jgi:two-component system phosphate regulon response regulator PhoB
MTSPDSASSSPPSSSPSASSTPSAATKVLLVDDEPDLQRLLSFNLREAGFVVEAAGTGAEGLALGASFEPAVVILDLMLPDLSGTEICRQMRAHPKLADVAILMLTARGDEYDRVLGFEVGADDYVVKPFSVRELLMRVRGLGKRAHERRIARGFGAHGAASAGPIERSPEKESKRLQWSGLEVDTLRHHVFVDGAELSLRPLEFKLLSLFLEHPGVVFSRAQLLEDVWGITTDVSTRTVDTHIRRLRERLGPYGDAIETVHGFGYRLAAVAPAR